MVFPLQIGQENDVQFKLEKKSNFTLIIIEFREERDIVISNPHRSKIERNFKGSVESDALCCIVKSSQNITQELFFTKLKYLSSGEITYCEGEEISGLKLIPQNDHSFKSTIFP